MSVQPITLDAAAATRLVRGHLDAGLRVTSVRSMPGGTRSAVYEWTTDGQPGAIVAKIAPAHGDEHLRQEYAALCWYRRHTGVVVPEPYLCTADSQVTGHTCLLMQRLPGRNLSEAKLTVKGRRSLQHQLALQVAELHRHRRARYGNALHGQDYQYWLEWFAPLMRKNFATVRDRLSARSQWVIGEVLDKLHRWLPESHHPTLVHGDLWANNIIVDDIDVGRPMLSGFIDGDVDYCDVEYELAYLRVFKTVDHTFFETYCQSHPLRSGFEQRCRVYWLNTAMTHVTTFGASYLTACERIADELHKLV